MIPKNFTFRCPDHPKIPLKHQGQNFKYVCVHCSFFVQQRNGTFFTNYKSEDNLRFSSSPSTSKVVSRNESASRALYRKLTSARSKVYQILGILKKNLKKRSISYWWWRIRHWGLFCRKRDYNKIRCLSGFENSLLAMLMQFHLQMMSLI